MNTFSSAELEIERVKDLVRKERETNIPIYDITGCRGRSIKVYKDRCVITTDVTLGSLLTSNATDGEKTIFYSDIIGVQYKPCGITVGYIQLETASGQMNNIQSNQFGENTFTFEKNDRMDEVRDYIIYQISRYKQTKTNLKDAHEHLSYSFKYDILTPDRRNRIVKLVMRDTGDAWNLSIQVQCRSKVSIKAILADLDIKNVFDDDFFLQNVQFLFDSRSPEHISPSSMEWVCQIPNEYARSITSVDIHVKKVAYEGELVDEDQIAATTSNESTMPRDEKAQHKKPEEIIREISLFRRARDMHDYLLTEIEHGTISIPDVDLDDLKSTVSSERMYGVMPGSYLNKLKNILREIYGEE